MDKFEASPKTVNLGLYLGLSSLLLLAIGVSFYDNGLDETFNNNEPTLAPGNSYHRYVDDEEGGEDNVGSMLSNWLEDSDDQETYFTRILRGNEEGDVLYEDELVAAVSAIPSRAPVHFIVFPKKPVKNLSHAVQLANSEILLGRLMFVAEKLARELDIANSGYRIVSNNGRDADQVIQHLHLHVIGGQSFGWPPWPVDKQDLMHKENVDVDYVDIPDDDDAFSRDYKLSDNYKDSFKDSVDYDDEEEAHDDMLLAQRIGFPVNLDSTQPKIGDPEMHVTRLASEQEVQDREV
jgi:histidine triad (HIT) family protein